MATKAKAYRQMGGSLDYVNSTDALIEAFTVIPYGDRVGIAGAQHFRHPLRQMPG